MIWGVSKLHYSFDMWSQVSENNNHCAWTSLSVTHLWWHFAVKLQISPSSGMDLCTCIWYKEFNAKASKIKMLNGCFMTLLQMLGALSVSRSLLSLIT